MRLAINVLAVLLSLGLAAPHQLREPAVLSTFSRAAGRTAWVRRAWRSRTIDRRHLVESRRAGFRRALRRRADLRAARSRVRRRRQLQLRHLRAAFEGWGAFGVGIVFLSYGESEGTDEQGNQTGNFGSNEFSPALYYGTQILPTWRSAPRSSGSASSSRPAPVGRRLDLRLDLRRSTGSAGAAQLRRQRPEPGPSVTFINEDQADPLSRNVKVGAASQAVPERLRGRAGHRFQRSRW